MLKMQTAQLAHDTFASIRLDVPLSFDIPSEYAQTSPEENAAVLLLGLSILESLRKESYTARMKELERQLEEERDASEKFRSTLQTLNSFMSGCVDDAVDRSFVALGERVNELVRSSMAKDKSDRDAVLSSATQLRDSVERRVLSIGDLLDRVGELSNLLKGANTSRYLSSVKGRDNESNSRQLIIDTFGTVGSNFLMHQKQDYSGDHIFDWNGIRLMWEDKIYATPVPRAEVEKAWRDFDANEDCRVLLFVSAHTSIQGYESASGLVSELKSDRSGNGSRLILYLSCFKNQLDPAGYIRTVIQTIIEAMKPILIRTVPTDNDGTNDEQDGHSRELEERFRIISNMIMSQAQALHNEEKACDALVSDHKVKVMGIRGGISRTRESLIKMTAELITLDRADSTGAEVGAGAATAANTSASVPGVASSRRRTCAICRQPGHWSTTCPQKGK